jgi:mono/diheme cytochrome c family protein
VIRPVHPIIGLAVIVATVIGLTVGAPAQGPGAPSAVASSDLERGRYMVLTGHCNNCHTAGYTRREGKVPESEWLLGSGPLGYRGPWGTTYASNLRLTVPAFSEDAWAKYAKGLRARPPMPWWSLQETSEADLRAMYRYIKSLGPRGEPAKPYVPPDQEPTPPYELRQLVQ